MKTTLKPQLRTRYMALLALALLLAVTLDSALDADPCGIRAGEPCTTDTECACAHPGTNGDPE